VDALRGESIEYAGDGGANRSVFGSGADFSVPSNVGDADLWFSQLHEQVLSAVGGGDFEASADEGSVEEGTMEECSEGAEVGVVRPDILPVKGPVKGGLAIDTDLRKSV